MSSSLQLSPTRQVVILGILPVVTALVFFFWYPRFYSLWCRMTGTQLSPNAAGALLPASSTGRMVEVNFLTRVFNEMPVEFRAEHERLQVEIGQDARTIFHFTNLSDKPLRFRPLHLVSPTRASAHFGLKLCFCFNDQTLAAHEAKSFPVIFRFAPEMDARIHHVTINYSVFPLKDQGAGP